ncbi:hypothetical protein C8D77_102778 [Mesorhizobium loti]|uniref:Uncharacterized protein n=1 Tax=Rhizobium loti TaxID=381 RepID=A0A8E2WIE7_RHILI|nr:hypothetical protein C8D77_102778 [Mesorhizobium loti]
MAKSWELRKDILRPPLSRLPTTEAMSGAPVRHPPLVSRHRPRRGKTRLLLAGLRGCCLRLGRGCRFLHRCRRLRCRRLLCRCSLRCRFLGRCSFRSRLLCRCRLLHCGFCRSLCSRLLGRRRLRSRLCRRLGRCRLLHCRFCSGLYCRLLGRCCFCLGRGRLRLGSRCCFLHCSCDLRRRCFYGCFLCRCLGRRRFG